jgi:YD repeat-containing protein
MRTLTHSHDADGLRTGLVYPGGKVLAAGYTARGQLGGTRDGLIVVYLS